MKFPFLFKSPETTAAPKTAHSPAAVEEPEFSVECLRSSDRFFFEPERTNNIMEEAKTRAKRVSVLEIDSTDPFLDFRDSMEEMAEAHALRDWDDLENLLSCYLRVNGKTNRGYIIGAFVDLVFRLALDRRPDFPDESSAAAAGDGSRFTSSSDRFTSPLYSFSSYSSANCL